MAKRNAGPLRLRMARRMTFRLALLALAASMASGHSATLGILADILLIASIILTAIACRVYFPFANGRKHESSV